jgi:hypothetical protein
MLDIAVTTINMIKAIRLFTMALPKSKNIKPSIMGDYRNADQLREFESQPAWYKG